MFIKLFLILVTTISYGFNVDGVNSANNPQTDKTTISNFYVLGDSLSDIGVWRDGYSDYSAIVNKTRYRLDDNYYQGRSWCNNKVAVTLIAEKLNLKFEPAWWYKLDLPAKTKTETNTKIFSKIGHNYAVGGEKIDTDKNNIVEKAFNLESQASMLLKQHQLQKTDLILIEMGANDLAILCHKAPTTDLVIIKKELQKILFKLVNVIALLIKNGATNIIVSDVPDLTLTPDIKEALVNRRELEIASKVCQIYQRLWKQNIKFMQQKYPHIIKPFYLSKSLLKNMNRFQKIIPGAVINTSAGSTITKESIKDGITTYTYTWVLNKGVVKTDIDKYFYFDKFHPSGWFHKQIANEILMLI